MKHLLALLIFLAINTTYGQKSIKYEGDLGDIYNFLEYPRIDKENGNEGVVILKFKTDGSTIDSMMVLNSISKSIDKESIRVFLLSQGKWSLTPNKYYLFKFRFTLNYSGKISTKKLEKKRDKALKSKNYEELISNCLLIKKREPFNIQNLDLLINAYQYTSQIDKMNSIKSYKNDIENIELIELK